MVKKRYIVCVCVCVGGVVVEKGSGFTGESKKITHMLIFDAEKGNSARAKWGDEQVVGRRRRKRARGPPGAGRGDGSGHAKIQLAPSRHHASTFPPQG